jgi:outer membrane protein TolC
LDESRVAFLRPQKNSPLVTYAMAQVDTAESSVSKAQAQHWPKLIAVGSAGQMQKSRVVPKQDYAAAIGIELPIFEGFRISNDVRRAEAQLERRKAELDQAQLDLNTLVADYDHRIRAAKAQLSRLEGEHETALKALQLAKERYVSYRGLLVDVRESIRNLARIKTEIADAKADLLLATGSKAILLSSQ